MNHALAVLALSAACVAWYLVQRVAARDEEAACEDCEQPATFTACLPDPTCPEDPTPRDPR